MQTSSSCPSAMKLHSGFNKNQQDYYDEIQAPSTEFHDELLASGIKHHIAFRSFPVSKNISNRRSGPVTVFYHRIFLTVIFLFTVSLPRSSRPERLISLEPRRLSSRVDVIFSLFSPRPSRESRRSVSLDGDRRLPPRHRTSRILLKLLLERSRLCLSRVHM